MLRVSVLVAALILSVGGPTLLAQNARLSGRVSDSSGAMVQQARVEATSAATNRAYRATTAGDGRYHFAELPPGRYRLVAAKEGFRQTVVDALDLPVGARAAQDMTLQVGQPAETVTVEARSPLINREDGTVSTLIGREQLANMPINGRSFQALIELAPGVTLSRATSQSPGQFSVNGQRTNANYFLVDGVSGNAGASFSAQWYQQAGGTQPGLTAQGGSNGLVSMDAVEEFRVTTSSFSPEFGRTPGGQIQVLTRSGGNRLTGSLYHYFRNEKLDANDWFLNANRQGRLPLRQNQFGGVLGGPVLLPGIYSGRNRTFFFLSYEGQRLQQPQVNLANNLVPAAESRQRATGVLREMVNAFPLPNSPALPGDPAGYGRYVKGRSFPSRFDAGSARLDHRFSDSINVFYRYNQAPSDATQLAFANGFNRFQSNLVTHTGAMTWTLSPTVNNDLRLNWTRSDGLFDFGGREIDGAVLPSAEALRPGNFGAGVPASTTIAIFPSNTNPTSLSIGRSLGNVQRQFNLVETLAWTRGAHQFRFGLDYRRLTPEAAQRQVQLTYNFAPNLETVLATGRVNATINQFVPVTQFRVENWSAFAQDTWRANRRLTLTYGFRYELNPPPTGPRLPYVVRNLETPLNATLAPPNTALYQTAKLNFAPRLGFAWTASERLDLVIRAGAGMFYDVAQGTALRGYNSFPATTTRLLNNVTLPLSAADLTPTPLTVAPPYSGQFFVFQPDLALPYTLQYNVTMEKGFGDYQKLSVAFVGAGGRKQLRQERLANLPATLTPGYNGLITLNPAEFATGAQVFYTRNGSNSSYNALQVQFQRRLQAGFSALAAYTWAKSIDLMSDDVSSAVPLNGFLVSGVLPGGTRGPSDFDVRHNLTAALSFAVGKRFDNTLARALLRGWGADTLLRLRTGFPITVISQQVDILNIATNRRVDLIPNQPHYLADSNVPGGRRLNPAAFAQPGQARQGNLGRNAIRAFGAQQVDLALRRDFFLTERTKLQFRGELFNVLNHANFGDPATGFGLGTFGVATSMLSRNLGGGLTQGGLNPLYQVGGPRSVQLSLRLSF